MRWCFLLLCSGLWVLMACAAPPRPPSTATAATTAQRSEELARALAIAAVS